MARFVVEPATALKWFVPEENSGQAARLLDGGYELLAPDTILAETGKLITAKVRMRECSREEGVELLEAVWSAPLWLHPTQPLLEAAFRIASAMDRPLRDGLNLALAVATDCRLVTVQRDLFERMYDTPFASYLKWVGDLR